MNGQRAEVEEPMIQWSTIQDPRHWPELDCIQLRDSAEAQYAALAVDQPLQSA